MAGELKADLDVEGSVPRYLYRTYSNNSKGRNSVWSFRPGSMTYDDKLSDIPHQRAKDMLENHLLWRAFRGDQFVSWTSSLLWALQLALRKHWDPKYPDGDIQICVLDTSKIETSSFFAASDLLRIYEVADEGKLAHRYYVAEYLYHGGLFVHGSSSIVSLDVLVECGLFKLLRELNDPSWRSSLCNAVAHFRGTMFSVTRPITPVEGRTALQLASLFEKPFTMPVMVALLSLRCRDPDDSNFLTLVADNAEPSRDFTGRIAPHWDVSIEAPELAHFRHLMNEAYAMMQEKRAVTEPGDIVDSLSASMDNLDATLKEVPNTVLSPSALPRFPTPPQAPKVILGKRARQTGNPRLQSEHWTAKPFPARLPSGLPWGKSTAPKESESIAMTIVDEY